MSKPYSDWIRFLSEHPDKIDVLASGDLAETADVVICRLVSSPLVYPDNLVSPCSKCHRLVQFRPHAPKTPKRMCDECAGPLLAEQVKDKDFRSFITPNTAADLVAFLRRKRMS